MEQKESNKESFFSYLDWVKFHDSLSEELVLKLEVLEINQYILPRLEKLKADISNIIFSKSGAETIPQDRFCQDYSFTSTYSNNIVKYIPMFSEIYKLKSESLNYSIRTIISNFSVRYLGKIDSSQFNDMIKKLNLLLCFEDELDWSRNNNISYEAIIKNLTVLVLNTCSDLLFLQEFTNFMKSKLGGSEDRIEKALSRINNSIDDLISDQKRDSYTVTKEEPGEYLNLLNP